jgi:uncharacterized protein
VIVPDVNLLLYAHVTTFPEHPAARRWWEALMNGNEPVGVAAPALFGFVRIATSARVFDPPIAVERPHVRVPGSRHIGMTFSLLRRLGAGGNLTTDAQLAALAIEHQAELHSNDVDFGRFEGLRWVNPLRQ